MSVNPVVLGFHFLLEIAALVAVGYWGWTRHDGLARWGLAVGLPLAAAVVWALFRAVGDGPEPTVAVPGAARLALELLVLLGAAFLLWQAGQPTLAAIVVALIILDYVLQYDRVMRLLGF